MKKILMAFAALALVGGLSSCKPKQSAYRAAYERAKQRELAQEAKQKTESDDITPITKVENNAAVVRERVRPAEGEDANKLKEFSVVIGSFQNITNAKSLKERMVADGYNATLAMNDMGMYRVIASSFDTKDAAVVSRENIKTRYPNQFDDAWILCKQ